MTSLLSKIKVLATKCPLLKGMVSYSFIWPAGSIVQQKFEGKTWGNYDWYRCLRYSLFGGFFMAPTLYGWFKVSTAMWPQNNLWAGLMNAVVGQFSYSPAAMISFFFIMSLMEMKTMRESIEEVQNKLLPSYKVSICFWPVINFINFTMVSEPNRVPFSSVCSLIWTIFLAYMKHLEHQDQEKEAKTVSH